MLQADPGKVSSRAKKRGLPQVSMLFSVSVCCPQSQCIVISLSLSVMSSVSVYFSQCHVLSLSVMSSVSVSCPQSQCTVLSVMTSVSVYCSQCHVLTVISSVSVYCPQSQCFVLSLTCIIEICKALLQVSVLSSV